MWIEDITLDSSSFLTLLHYLPPNAIIRSKMSVRRAPRNDEYRKISPPFSVVPKWNSAVAYICSRIGL